VPLIAALGRVGAHWRSATARALLSNLIPPTSFIEGVLATTSSTRVYHRPSQSLRFDKSFDVKASVTEVVLVVFARSGLRRPLKGGASVVKQPSPRATVTRLCPASPDLPRHTRPQRM